jgi:hypothetical protein
MREVYCFIMPRSSHFCPNYRILDSLFTIGSVMGYDWGKAYPKAYRKPYGSAYPKARGRAYWSAYRKAYPNAYPKTYRSAYPNACVSVSRNAYRKAYRNSGRKAYRRAYPMALGSAYRRGLTLGESTDLKVLDFHRLESAQFSPIEKCLARCPHPRRNLRYPGAGGGTGQLTFNHTRIVRIVLPQPLTACRPEFRTPDFQTGRAEKRLSFSLSPDWPKAKSESLKEIRSEVS